MIGIAELITQTTSYPTYLRLPTPLSLHKYACEAHKTLAKHKAHVLLTTTRTTTEQTSNPPTTPL